MRTDSSRPPRAILLAALAAVILGGHLSAETAPKSLRVGVVGNPYGKPFGGGVLGILQEQGTLEANLKKNGTTVEWNVFKGTGPAINEAFGAGAIDIAVYGDLPSILARSGGLKTRLVAAGGRGQNIYIGVPATAAFRTLADLKGQRLSTLRGTYMHLAFNKVIRDKGLAEKDFRFINLNTAEGYAALASNKLDAYVGPSNILELRDKGTVRLVYSTKDPGTPGEYRGFSAVVVTDDFLAKHPSTVKGFLVEYAKAAAWSADAKNFNDYLRIIAKTGTPEAVTAADLAGTSLLWDNDPLLDGFFVRQVEAAIDFSKANGLLKNDFAAADWIAAQPLRDALKEAGLEKFWDQANSGK